MTTRVKGQAPAPVNPSPLVLFGIDSRGKPKGRAVWKAACGVGH